MDKQLKAFLEKPGFSCLFIKGYIGHSEVERYCSFYDLGNGFKNANTSRQGEFNIKDLWNCQHEADRRRLMVLFYLEAFYPNKLRNKKRS